MLISVKQINQVDLLTFVLNSASGSAFSGNLAGYFGGSGWFGNYVFTTSGGTINGPVIFQQPIEVPMGGDTGSATNILYVTQAINSGISIVYSQITGNTLSVSGNDFIGGYKFASGRFAVAGLPQVGNDVVNLNYLNLFSGILSSGIGNVTNGVDLVSNQLISGIKTFNSIPGSLGIPVNPTDLATKNYVDNSTSNIQGAVTTSGLNQGLSGIYNFTNSLTVPIATQSTNPATLAQLQALGTVMGGITGFAGVASLNGTSGASGNVYLVGAGNVMVIQCGPIFYISGNTANLNQLYAGKILLTGGVTGLQINFASGFNSNPIVVGNLEASGFGSLSYIVDTVYNVNVSGFSVGFQTAIPNTPNYYFDFTAFPSNSGIPGWFGLQGNQGGLGPSFNTRGIWQQAQTYSPYDITYNPPYNATFLCYAGNISTTFNQPGGTGNSNWVILTSGAQGVSGIWNAFYNFTGSGQIFNYGATTFYNGNSYGYTGLTPTSGTAPTGAGWNIIAQQGGIGYFINSGTITGGFVNLSFFLNPVNTGLNLAEAFVGAPFIVTGFALGCIASGTGISIGGYPGPLSGDFYTRDLNNNKNIIQNFTFNTGIYTYISGGIALSVSGYSRVGVDLTNTLGNIQGFSIGIFGFSLT